MEVDDLLLIIEAAAMLDFLRVHEGDAEITEAGHAFAEADILTRKLLFREAALKHVTLLRQIEHALRAKSDHTLLDDFFYDILDKYFSEEDLPVTVSVIDTEEKIRHALPVLREMIGEGLVVMTDVEVLHHISGKRDSKK